MDHPREAKRKYRSLSRQHSYTTLEPDDLDPSQWVSRKRPKFAQRDLAIPTDSDTMIVSLPNHQKTFRVAKDLVEVGLCYTAKGGRSTKQIRARFFRDLHYASQSRIYAHLDVFVIFEGSVRGTYRSLFRSGSLSNIDEALRKGVISPFHVHKNGFNLFLFVSDLPVLTM